jgi:HK97 family phage prohead protease
MLHGGHLGGLELRREGGETRLSGSFPYNRETVLWDGGRTGRPHKEVIAARAFSRRLTDPEAEVHFLVGHDFDRPLASRKAGTLTIRETDQALAFEARIAADLAGVTWVSDLLASARAGLIVGLSPGFRVAPEEDAEMIEDRGDDILRTVRAADLFEVSAVTRPAYPEAQIEARSWRADANEKFSFASTHPLKRWRL